MLSLCGSGFMRASSFIFVGRVRGGSVYGLFDACGGWREKQCESYLGDNVIY